MSNFLRDNKREEFEIQMNERLESNGLLDSEIKALIRLEDFGKATKRYRPTFIQEEIDRRERFLEELLREI